MPEKTIITAAITGAEVTREHNPNLPITPEELAHEAYNCYKAGAAIIHLHVRENDGTPTQSVEIFNDAIERIKDRCDVIVEVTTGGAVGMSDEERVAPVSLSPDMASLDCGSVNFGDDYLLNSMPTLRMFAEKMNKHNVKPTIECFDFAHINNAKILAKEGLIKPPFYFSFVMGVPGGIPATVKNLLYMVEELPEGSSYAGIGIGGRASLPIAMGCLILGGHVRVGFEDNVYYSKGVLAESNAQLVKRVAMLSREIGREVATVAEAREMLGLK